MTERLMPFPNPDEQFDRIIAGEREAADAEAAALNRKGKLYEADRRRVGDDGWWYQPLDYPPFLGRTPAFLWLDEHEVVHRFIDEHFA